MIKIWDYSNHVHHTPPPDNKTRNCRFYLNCCIDTAREQWHAEYIFFDTANYKFQFCKKELTEIMANKCENVFVHLIECILRDNKHFFIKKTVSFSSFPCLFFLFCC